MGIQYRDFLDSAKSILKHNNNCAEIDLRNAISRAYYSAYHICASKFLPANVKGKGSHERLIIGMMSSEDDQVKELAEQLKNLKRKRHKADYKLEILITEHQTFQSLEESEALCKLAEKASPQFKGVS